MPFTTLRTTQVHDLMLTTAKAMAKLPVIPAPAYGSSRSTPPRSPTGSRSSPSARRPAWCPVGPPAGLVPDIGGPQVYDLRHLTRLYLEARGKHRLFMPVRQPGKPPARSARAPTLALDRAVGRRTWEEFLADRVGPAGVGSGALAT